MSTLKSAVIKHRVLKRQQGVPMKRISVHQVLKSPFQSQSKSSQLPPVQDSPEYLTKLINKLLSNKSGDSPELPTLTASNDLDLEMYALFALLINNFVTEWYSKSLLLGSSDEFNNELIFVFAHLSREWQERSFQNVCWQSVLLTDLFVLLDRHFRTLKNIKENIGTRFDVLYGDGKEEIEIENKDSRIIAAFLSQCKHFSTGREEYYSKVLVKSIVGLSLPVEELDSKLTRDFLIVILNDLVFKNLIENLSQNYVIWDIFGSICDGLNKDNAETKKLNKSNEETADNIEFNGILDRVGNLFKPFISDAESLKNTEILGFDNLIPLMGFINLIFQFDIRFPLINLILSLFLKLILSFIGVKKLFSKLIKKIIFKVVLTDKTFVLLFRILRKMMFPTDDNFFMKPRFIPSTDIEYKEMLDNNKLKMSELFKTKPHLLRLFLDSSNSVDQNNELDKKLESFLNCFKHKEINKILLWNVIDLIASSIFPEMLSMNSNEIINRFKN